ncbi:4-hydroxyphenylacetate 3-hydroxylase N-terminal domain-containing protein [Chloroflexota bacterium]
MAIKTPEQYLQSLQDNRVVYFEGERIKDVTSHPVLGLGANMCAMDYAVGLDPKFRNTFVAKDDKGEEVSFVFTPAKSAEDLLRLRDIIQLLARTRFGQPGGAKFTGVDALHSLTIGSKRIDKEMGTNYSVRVEEYRKFLLENDLAIVACMTDVKGDRSVRPSKQQAHKDYYLRIIDEKKNGIVVRGAKMHISHAACANEMIVMPCRAMSEEDKDYAVVCAVPINTKGITIITSEESHAEADNYFDYPLSASVYSASGLVVFDDVFIPTERVFLKKEWQFSANYTYLFADFHRLSADSYTYTELEVLVGLAALLAEYNGLDKVQHIRDKLARLMLYAEGVEALGKAAAVFCVKEPGTELVYPNPVYSNISKFYFADNFHQAVKILQDIGGGLVANAPSSKDFFNHETRPLLEKYFGGKAEIATENRLRAMRLARDLPSAWKTAATIHAEGSLATQLLSVYMLGDWDKFKAAAKRVARIDDGTRHPIFNNLPSFPAHFDA